MESITFVNAVLLFGAALVLVGILSSLVAQRFGAPLLLVFLLIGVVVGEDGPGGIRFQDYQQTYLIGSLALAIILFDGGLRSKLATFHGVIGPALTLASGGVLITAGLTGLVAAWLLGLPILQGLLIGATVASTDAAAVFLLLRSGGLQLRQRVNSMLEIESGTNDPIAVFLTLLLVELVLQVGDGDRSAGLHSLALLLQQALIGGALGVAGGYAITALVNRVELPSGLQPLAVVSMAVSVFALAALLEGSGFLAVYLAGLVVGNQQVRGIKSITGFHDSLTWLSQIVMFIVLGLLVTPSSLVPSILPAIGIALFLMLVGRPLAVVLCLTPFGFDKRETAFIGWVGLRGAVSIFLAAIPTLAGLPHGEVFFNVAFVVVFISLVVQGWTIRPLAMRLKLAIPRSRPKVHRMDVALPGQSQQELVGYFVEPGSPILVGALPPRWAKPMFVVREDAVMEAQAAGDLVEGDYGYFLAPPERIRELDRLFAATRLRELAKSHTRFPLRADVRLGQIADLYGFTVEPELRGRTVAEHINEAFEGEPGPGDQLALGPAALVVRKTADGIVTEAELEIDPDDGEGEGVPAGRAAGRLEQARLWGQALLKRLTQPR